MAVVGTAGHVDHGKTLLIRALTGMDTDRLPEEKQRGMTIDLGFAHFLDPHGNPIGVIDVPGHERYIRNMVAGAWGIDCALLVVAADDGWMPQTETHARVLSVFRVPGIVLVLNKIDLVPPERVKQVEDEALSRCASLLGRAVPAARVSAKTGRGIEGLKEIILRELSRIGVFPPGPYPKGDSPVAPVQTAHPLNSQEGGGGKGSNSLPRLYLDRVFSLKGAGTIVAGSLREGRVRINEELILLPRGERVRARRIQTYGRDVGEVFAGRETGAVRVALNLAGVTASPERGDCLVPLSAIQPKEGRSKGGLEWEPYAEFLGIVHLVSPLRQRQEAEITYGTAHQKLTLYRLESRASLGPDGKELVRGVLERPAPLCLGDRFLLMRPGGADILGWGEVARLGKTSSKQRNTLRQVFRHTGKLPALEEAPVRQKRGIQEETRPAPELSGPALSLLKEIRSRGETPWELERGRGPAVRESLDQLCKRAMVVPLDTTLYLDAQVYRDLAGRLLRGRKPGSRLPIAEAKQLTGLSRKYILPLLNRLERDGWVKRSADDRVVQREWKEE